MKNVFLYSTLAAVVSMAASTATQAMTLSLSPAAQSTAVGASIDLNVQISGLYDSDPNEVLSAYGIGISFDTSLFSATGVDFGNLLGGGTGDSVALFDSTTTAGLLTLNETSFLTDADLKSLQSDSFTLGTVHFTSLAEGTGAFTFQGISLAGQTLAGSIVSSELPVSQTAGSRVTAERSQQVPEPSTLWLLSACSFILFFNGAKRTKII